MCIKKCGIMCQICHDVITSFEFLINIPLLRNTSHSLLNHVLLQFTASFILYFCVDMSYMSYMSCMSYRHLLPSSDVEKKCVIVIMFTMCEFDKITL